MKSNSAFAKFEILIVITLLLFVFAYLGYCILGGSIQQKLNAMRDDAINFSKTVTVNIASFHNTENVYLDEVISESLLRKMKNPMGRGFCSESESIVQLIDGMPYVTLRCGDVLIEQVNFSDESTHIPFYKVSKWIEKKKDISMEEKKLYNCVKDGKELFDQYYDELYLVYRINKMFETNYYFAKDVATECEVVSKTFYRTKELMN